MANTKSAKRATRVAQRRAEVNKSRRSRMKTVVRTVELALAAGNQQAASEALKAAEPVMMRSAQKGLVHKRSASRKVSRLAKRVRALAGAGGGAPA